MTPNYLSNHPPIWAKDAIITSSRFIVVLQIKEFSSLHS